MKLNTFSVDPSSRKTKKRVGRGISAGQGKTCGRGVKGQKARSGGYHKVGFEGGQMPLQRRLPKVGFYSEKSKAYAEVRLSEINKLTEEIIDIDVLISNGIVPTATVTAKVILSGELNVKKTLRGIKVTAGAQAKIEELGGVVE
jgi:large subunit ribosomal protein L15